MAYRNIPKIDSSRLKLEAVVTPKWRMISGKFQMLKLNIRFWCRGHGWSATDVARPITIPEIDSTSKWGPSPTGCVEVRNGKYDLWSCHVGHTAVVPGDLVNVCSALRISADRLACRDYYYFRFSTSTIYFRRSRAVGQTLVCEATSKIYL
jgi:hypothetical protein